MELWLLFAVISSIFAGLQVFIQKIGTSRGYNSSLLNSYSAGISAFLGFILAGFLEGYGEASLWMLAVALLSGVVYITGVNFRMDAFRYMDVTIFMPLQKFLAPLLALFIGILFFGEVLSTAEWWGIILGMVVPLMLLTKSENSRQGHLAKGLVLMVVSAILAAFVAGVNKYGANVFTSVILFGSFANALSAIFGAILYRNRKNDVDGVVETHHLDRKLLSLCVISGGIQMVSFVTFMLAFANDGALAIVYTIHSLYIIIPIVLAIICYNEHWNARKAVAIVLSLSAIFLMR